MIRLALCKTKGLDRLLLGVGLGGVVLVALVSGVVKSTPCALE